jgi:hypothetical protein
MVERFDAFLRRAVFADFDWADPSGAMGTFLSGGAARATATKKKSDLGSVFVRVVVTLRQ